MKQTRSLSEFSCLSKYTLLYPMKTTAAGGQTVDNLVAILIAVLWTKLMFKLVLDIEVSKEHMNF